jgi:isoleucyl-tRNA synthetase
VREELNVADLRFVAAAGELGSYEVKANYRSLGPLFGSQMPLAAAAIAALDPARVAQAVRGGEEVGIDVGGREHSLAPSDLILTMRAPEGYSVERDGAHAVALDLAVDEQLLGEGRAREIVHLAQNARRTAGLQVEDRIELELGGEDALLAAARTHERYIAQETLAVRLQIGDGVAAAGLRAPDYSEENEVEGLRLRISLSRAER